MLMRNTIETQHNLPNSYYAAELYVHWVKIKIRKERWQNLLS